MAFYIRCVCTPTEEINVGFPQILFIRKFNNYLVGFRTEVIFLIGGFFPEILNFLELLTFVLLKSQVLKKKCWLSTDFFS